MWTAWECPAVIFANMSKSIKHSPNEVQVSHEEVIAQHLKGHQCSERECDTFKTSIYVKKKEKNKTPREKYIGRKQARTAKYFPKKTGRNLGDFYQTTSSAEQPDSCPTWIHYVPSLRTAYLNSSSIQEMCWISTLLSPELTKKRWNLRTYCRSNDAPSSQLKNHEKEKEGVWTVLPESPP